MKKKFRIARSLTRYAGSAFGIVVFAACGGVSDPGLFSANGTIDASGSSDHGGVSLAGGESALGGTAKAGASTLGGTSAAGEAPTNGGAATGGSSSAGASNAGAGGAGHPGASGSAGSNPGGSGGAAGGAVNGGNAGSMTTAGSGGGGGSGGSGGGGGSGGSGETCQTLFANASKQLTAAQACNYAANAMQCTGTVKNPCNCEVAVNRKDSAETKAYEATLAQLEKKQCVQACTAIACLPATHATCQASAPGSITGACVGMYASPF